MAAVTAAVIGVVGGVASAAVSFSNAADQKKAAQRAEGEANKARKEARKRLEKDFYAGLTVPMDAYEEEFEQQLAGQQTAIEALQEGDARNLAAGVGRVGALANQAREKTRIDMGQDLFALDKMKADSKTDLNQQLADMDLSFAKQQSQMRRDAEAARAQSIQSGVSGITSALQSGASIAPLYGKSSSDIQGSKLAKKFASQKPEGMSDAGWAYTLSDDKFSKYLQGSSDNASAFKWNPDTNNFDFTDEMTTLINSTSGGGFNF